MDELERIIQMVREASLATGHASTAEELMAEVLDQVVEIRRDRIAGRCRDCKYWIARTSPSKPGICKVRWVTEDPEWPTGGNYDWNMMSDDYCSDFEAEVADD